MKLYLAAAFQRQAEIRGYRGALEAAGHEVTSRWLDNDAPDSVTLGKPCGEWAEFARSDVDDVRNADVLVSFTSGELARGGRHVEYGLAVAWGLQRVIVGPVEHVFHMLPGAIVFTRPGELLHWAYEQSRLLDGVAVPRD